MARHWPCADSSLHGDSAANEVNHCTFLLFCFSCSPFFVRWKSLFDANDCTGNKEMDEETPTNFARNIWREENFRLPLYIIRFFSLLRFALDEFRFLHIFRHSSSFLIVLIRIIVIIWKVFADYDCGNTTYYNWTTRISNEHNKN